MDTIKKETDEWDEWDPLTEHHFSSTNSLALDSKKDALSSLTGTLTPIAEKLGKTVICERFIKYGECMDRSYCSKLHVNPKNRDQLLALQETYETNKNRTIMNYSYLSPYDIKPDLSALLLVSVNNATSPNNFYVVMPYEDKDFAQCNPSDLKFYIDRVMTSSPLKAKLQNCHHQLAQIFDHKFRVDNVNDDIYVSQIVAVKMKDCVYRRAMVLERPDGPEGNFTLFLIDLGVSIELPREHIYDIKAHCLSEPPMAIHCRLPLKSANKALNWSDEALERFETLARGQTYLLCSILDYSKEDRIFTVDLRFVTSRASLTDDMLSSGLAEKTPVLKFI